MNVFFLKNLMTGKYVGEELEPKFERTWFDNMADAREAAWARNLLYKKDLTSLDKFVVEIKTNITMMYVKFGGGLKRRFFDEESAFEFFEKREGTHEIGYLKDGNECPINPDLDRDLTDELALD